MNPIVSEQVARTLPTDAPQWPIEETDGAMVKLSAAWLIENSGIPKGFALPGSRAAISKNTPLRLLILVGASAIEVLQLAQYIQTMVSNRFGINLKPEPLLVGF